MSSGIQDQYSICKVVNKRQLDTNEQRDWTQSVTKHTEDDEGTMVRTRNGEKDYERTESCEFHDLYAQLDQTLALYSEWCIHTEDLRHDSKSGRAGSRRRV